MAVSIRLRREGALNRPYYKVVVADKRSPRDGKFLELVGTYDPKAGPQQHAQARSHRTLAGTRRPAVRYGAQPDQEK